MKLSDFLENVGRPIAYYPRLAQVVGGVKATVFLCQLIYWRGKESDKHGWIYKTAEGWTYGFPELAGDHRRKLLESNRISNPGCYPTGAIALLRPLVEAGIVRADSAPAVFGVSGYTGGGKELIEVHEKNPDVEPFGLYGLEFTHKHVPEMKKYSKLGHAPMFVPSVAHYAQGMLIMVPLTRDIMTKKVTAKDVQQVLADYYAGETFVTTRPLADRRWLERDRFLRADRLVDTNSMELAVYGNDAEEQILAVASLDNLGKGASGAAVQVINLKTGVPETTGLAGAEQVAAGAEAVAGQIGG